MHELVAPMLTYAFVMTFTPGPNNVSSSALGMKVGYRGSLPYLLGIASGFLAIMLASGLLTDFLTRNYGVIAPYLKWIGVAYMVYLAASLLLEPLRKGKKAKAAREGYFGGLVLQILNIKVILYGITIYTSFSPLLTGTTGRTLLSAVSLSALGFVSVSTWSIVGAGLSRFLTKRAFRFAFDAAMAILLLYSALTVGISVGLH
jgi:threonine/homoserine/homoserine lactone efflux protein